MLLSFDLPMSSTPALTPRPKPPSGARSLSILLAAWFNTRIPLHRRRHAPAARQLLVSLLPDFWHCNTRLWRDRLGQISLATTTLFWGVSGNLRYIVLAWAAAALGYTRHAGLDPGGRGGHRHGRGRRGGVHAHAAGHRPPACMPLGIGMGVADRCC